MAKRDEFERANQRAKGAQATEPRVLDVRYDRKADRIIVQLASKVDLVFSPRDIQGLQNAKPSDLGEIEISPSGFGIYFLKLDVDLYVPALLEGFLGSRRWMAARLGEIGGKSRSVAKRAASRSNGSLGGRPRSGKSLRA